jgi:hypothetical protein
MKHSFIHEFDDDPPRGDFEVDLDAPTGASSQPRSRGLPPGLLDQPLYGWAQNSQTRILQRVSTGFVEEAFSHDAKAVDWKHAEAR